MRQHQPFDELSAEYFGSYGDQKPPIFVYGFPYRRHDKRANLFTELGRIPHEKWANTRKDLVFDAIGIYIRNSFEGDDPRNHLRPRVSRFLQQQGIDIMFYVYNSYRPC